MGVPCDFASIKNSNRSIGKNNNIEYNLLFITMPPMIVINKFITGLKLDNYYYPDYFLYLIKIQKC
ncbi:MAG: hypothetical protein A2X61_15005 [Ignavibacteria bacterium GWB2_35_12]|nr:MAG: hypothetical protein A2X61_15005 [Ignavibacteria bacterium GWB2_35_12]OGU91092.1 MAG: hypothetical protein A2220_17220 [Ignavibacteria bacterium RIFOXYA2_FULL_35_10]OGV22470.1 MAG: hypothetical protein A2475_10075 [Ignavibacteria bacterium RIFOXYC2_FULL_35_21]